MLRVIGSKKNQQINAGIYVTGFAKRGLIYASDFATPKRHNFVHD